MSVSIYKLSIKRLQTDKRTPFRYWYMICHVMVNKCLYKFYLAECQVDESVLLEQGVNMIDIHGMLFPQVGILSAIGRHFL